MKKITCITIVFMLAVAFSGIAHAQRGWRGGPGGFGKGPGCWNMFPGISFTQDQQAAMLKLQKEHVKEIGPIRSAIREKQIDLQALLIAPEPDEAKARATLKEISALRARKSEINLSFRLKARKILTPEQAAQLPPGCGLGFGGPGCFGGPGKGQGRRGGCGPAGGW